MFCFEYHSRCAELSFALNKLVDVQPILTKTETQVSVIIPQTFMLTYEPRHEKTGLQGFRPGPTQTALYRHRR